MNINTDRKRKYIQITSSILEKEGVKGISIRRIANEAGCTSAVLYKHFDNLNHLIILASVKFLEPYITEFIRVTRRKDISSIQMDLYLWKFFIRESYKNKPYYMQMFFSPDREMLEDYIYEYYTLFPDEEREFDGFSASIIFSNNLEEREHIRLRRAAHENLITADNAILLSRLSTAVFNGMFLRSPDYSDDRGAWEMAADDCFRMILELFRRFVNPGTDLSIEKV
ncbi:MAG: TetR/AcrR family transcriptional regulator [Lachnospiraceae bacterium]|nr:TetR/AcrR family transcriptional regulator [Lachnospiraceae bacterium]